MASEHGADGMQAFGSPATTAEADIERIGPIVFDFDYVVRMTQDEADGSDDALIRALLTSPERTRQV